MSDKPIFYPVTTEEYAVEIARDWNVPASAEGYVTRFHVRADFIDAFETREVGGRAHCEYWISAEDLPSLNNAIVGTIEVIRRFVRGDDGQPRDVDVAIAIPISPDRGPMHEGKEKLGGWLISPNLTWLSAVNLNAAETRLENQPDSHGITPASVSSTLDGAGSARLRGT